jgi:hypothetical protein
LSQSELMMSLRHFVQQVVDRSLTEANPTNSQSIKAVADDLAKQIRGSKNWITWLPFFLALAGGRLVPTLINSLSRLLHGGKQYFPGDVSLMDANKPSNISSRNASKWHHISTPHDEVFAGFTHEGHVNA